MTKEEYRTAWIEAEYIVAGWWLEPYPEPNRQSGNSLQGKENEMYIRTKHKCPRCGEVIYSDDPVCRHCGFWNFYYR